MVVQWSMPLHLPNQAGCQDGPEDEEVAKQNFEQVTIQCTLQSYSLMCSLHQ